MGAAGIGSVVGTAAGKPGKGEGFPPKGQTEYGDPVPLGDGEIKTFVTQFPNEKWTYVGVEMTAEAATMDHEEYHELIMHDLPFPDGTQYEFFGYGWNPHGHAPQNTYGVPHHDFHFYTIPREEVYQIPPINFDLEELNHVPEEVNGVPVEELLPDEIDQTPYDVPIPEDQFPDGYFRDHSVVPIMGEHLYSTDAPEWDGKYERSDEPFTHTHIWGHWDGELIFSEPMITVDFFESLEGTDAEAISMPERMPEAGEYGTEYRIAYHENRDAYTVTLADFEYFEESDGTT